jgi:hypothetical protein
MVREWAVADRTRLSESGDIRKLVLIVDDESIRPKCEKMEPVQDGTHQMLFQSLQAPLVFSSSRLMT